MDILEDDVAKQYEINQLIREKINMNRRYLIDKYKKSAAFIEELIDDCESEKEKENTYYFLQHNNEPFLYQQLYEEKKKFTTLTLRQRLDCCVALLNKTRELLVQELGISKQLYHSWCKDRNPTAKYLIILSNYFDVEPEWIASGKIHFTEDERILFQYQMNLINNRIKILEENNILVFENNRDLELEVQKYNLEMKKISPYSLLKLSKLLDIPMNNFYNFN